MDADDLTIFQKKMKEYKEMLEFSARHFKEVLEIAKKFNIELQKEEDFPK